MVKDYKDRDFWRCETNARLIEEAKYNPTAELAIVLAERLLVSEQEKYAYRDED